MRKSASLKTFAISKLPLPDQFSLLGPYA